VTSIGARAFTDCRGLTSVTIGNGVKDIGDYAFEGCSGLTSMTIPDGVTNIGNYAFRDCSGLTSVTIPNSVTNIGNCAFYCCGGLMSVTIPDSVTSIGYRAFQSCSGLRSMTIPDSVTSIGYDAFDGCSGLTSVMIGNSVTSIGDEAFYGCSGLTNVIFKGNAPTVSYSNYSPFKRVGNDCTAYVRIGSTGWGVDIPGTWNGLNIQYLTPEVEIAVANEVGDGTVEIEGVLPEVEVASGVTLMVKGENLDAAELAEKITPKPHEAGQSASLFTVKAESVAGGVSLAVDLDEDKVRPDETAAEIVGSESVAAFDAAADGENVSVSLPSAKPGLYYGIAAVSDLSQMDAAAANAPLVQASVGGATVPVAKPAGGSAFFKVIVSDRAR